MKIEFIGSWAGDTPKPESGPRDGGIGLQTKVKTHLNGLAPAMGGHRYNTESPLFFARKEDEQ